MRRIKIKHPEWLAHSKSGESVAAFNKGLYPEVIAGWMLVVSLKHPLRAIYGSDLRAALALLWMALWNPVRPFRFSFAPFQEVRPIHSLSKHDRLLGGTARAEKLSKDDRSSIAKVAAVARWEKAGKTLPRARYEGTLDNGMRVLTQSGVMIALGRARQAKGRQYYDGDVDLPAFLTAKNLKPFIPDSLSVTSSQIDFIALNGHRAFGYAAEILPLICGVFIDAKNADVLTHMQEPIRVHCCVLVVS